MAPEVTKIMAIELQKDAAWATAELAKFQELAKQYLLNPVEAVS